MRICFATNNLHKIQELESMLAGNIQLLSLKDIGCTEELAEDHETLQENAHQKAAYIADKYEVNCFADDTGLEVKALNGAPGVYSARYAGQQRSNQDNIKLLLQNLEGIADRTAQFRTVICAIIKGETHYFEGIVKGKIASELTGKEGFGYDPIFVPEGFNKTFAEMTMIEKNEISHRGRAVKKFVEFMKAEYL